MELIRGNIPDWALSGYGYGYGDGSGYGYGYGSGDGYGDGDGYGYGYGYGYGDGYWYLLGRSFIAAANSGILAFWRSSADALPANGGNSKEPITIGMRQSVAGPLSICNRGLHATMDPGKWKGERLWLVALHGEFQQKEDKFCALEREILAEIK